MTALGLKLLASVFMLIDHIGYCFYGPMILRIIGRLAFPIYVFQMTEGYRHTSNRLRYALRLAIFALVSQVPFGLMIEGVPFQRDLNVLFTLLIGYLSIWLLETFKHRGGILVLGLGIILGVQFLFTRDLLHADYGQTGIPLALAFYYLCPAPGKAGDPLSVQSDRRRQSLILLAACFLAVFSPSLIHYLGQLARAMIGRPWSISAPNPWSLAQLYSLLAVPLCLLYDGSRGWTPKAKTGRKAFQLAFYAYYPVHILILVWLKDIL